MTIIPNGCGFPRTRSLLRSGGVEFFDPGRSGGRPPAAAGQQPADDLDDGADGDRGAEGDDEPRPRVVLEGLAADAADEERVERPDDGGHRGRGDEAPARVPGDAAGEGHRGAA